MPYLQSTLDRLGQVDRFARANAIPITYITPVLPTLTLRRMDLDQLLGLRHQILDRIGAYSDMTYQEGISDDIGQFADSSHLTRDGLSHAFTSDRLAAARVTPETVDARFAWIKEKIGGHAVQ